MRMQCIARLRLHKLMGRKGGEYYSEKKKEKKV